MLSPVRWSAEVERADTCAVTFTAVLNPGWHLYALELPEGGPRPTEIDLTGSRGMTVVGTPEPSRAAAEIDDEMFGMRLAWWDGEVSFRVPFVIVDAADACIEARITYMVCNAESCRPPHTQSFSIPMNNQ